MAASDESELALAPSVKLEPDSERASSSEQLERASCNQSIFNADQMDLEMEIERADGRRSKNEEEQQNDEAMMIDTDNHQRGRRNSQPTDSRSGLENLVKTNSDEQGEEEEDDAAQEEEEEEEHDPPKSPNNSNLHQEDVDADEKVSFRTSCAC